MRKKPKSKRPEDRKVVRDLVPGDIVTLGDGSRWQMTMALSGDIFGRPVSDDGSIGDLVRMDPEARISMVKPRPAPRGP